MKRIPFSEDELVVKGTYPFPFPGVPPISKLSTPVTAGENYLSLLKREKPLWLPTMFDQSNALASFLPDNLARRKGGQDFFGIEWIYVEVVGGATVKPGKPFIGDMNEWKEKIVFPNLDEYPWETAKDDLIEDDERLASATILNGLYERIISLMDFQYAAMALIDEDQEEAILEFFDIQADFYNKLIDKYIEHHNIKMLSFHDDWGGQHAPFFSPATVRKMILPALKKVVSYAHSKGLFVDMHSCGKNELLTPCYIEAGIDSWTPQTMNDTKMLYEKYGDQIIIGVSAPTVDPNATDDEVYAAAEEFVSYYCQDGKPPITVSVFMAHPKMREALYKASRIALNS